MATCSRLFTNTDVKNMHTQHFASMFNMVLKEEELQVVCNAINGFHCFVVLPTGFGESTCFILMPLLLNLVSNIWINSALAIVHMRSCLNQIKLQIEIIIIIITFNLCYSYKLLL